uniref:Uncharacterized protein n=1 Tax=Utricularia reniformis TaxID=192314 RepID=A0A1Y0AZ80_9LAMI|nr:hypothetical protein AEK19_MT2172 [Utricularia reniformis]ART30438.1 hypothetical protein AEK19_MT2172 [Utricularia reniformis]
MADHLSRLKCGSSDDEDKNLSIDDAFPLMAIAKAPWYADFINYNVCGVLPLIPTEEVLCLRTFRGRTSFVQAVCLYIKSS